MRSLHVMPPLNIGPFSSKLPIVQGGMGVAVSLSGLASAVANQGGIGVISAALVGMLESDYERNFKEANRRALVKEIRKARALTSGIIGCNIMVAATDYFEMVDTALDEQIDLLFLGAGLPLKFSKNVTPERIQTGHTRFVPIVSSARALRLICETWKRLYNTIPDAFVLEGPMAGGHLGFKREHLDCPAYALEFLLEETVKAARPYEDAFSRPLPIIAAGGVYTGRDIWKMLDMGASGVQMGTRFVATHECDADIAFKESFVGAAREDLEIIQSPVGLPGRAITNRFLKDVGEGQKKPFKCPWKCLRTCDFKEAPYCIAKALVNARLGIMEDGFVFAGSNAWRVNEIIPVESLMNQLIVEYVESIEKIVVAV